VAALAALGIVFANNPADSECINYRDYLHWVGSVDTPDVAHGVAVVGVHAYVADRASGLQVIDISDSRNPEIIGSVDTPGDAWGVDVLGGFAYVTD
jgi:hypothetical protein